MELFSNQESDVDQVIEAVPIRILMEDNEKLLTPFTIDEFRNATLSMHPDKSPGPDGFNAAFYNHFWKTCGLNVSNSCLLWLEEGKIPAAINNTNIALIPKCDAPTSMKDLHSISLCNMVYKILSKNLVNRSATVIGSCVSEERSTFINGRSMVDNALIANEVLHYMKCGY